MGEEDLVMEAQSCTAHKQHIAFLSLGSNVGDTRHHLESAREELMTLGVTTEVASPLYATEPVDFKEQPWFLNRVVRVHTTLTPMELLEVCSRIEDMHLRQREIPKGPRTLDIDILLYDDLIVEHPQLRIPHPQIPLRRFVLEPLASLVPDEMHPVLHDTFQNLLAKCQDRAQVQRMEETD